MSLIKWLWAIAIGGVVVWALLGFGPYWHFGKTPDAGQFGDSFGVANSFATSVAMIGALIAIFLQMHELKLQHESQLGEAQDRSAAARATLLTNYLASLNCLVTNRDGLDRERALRNIENIQNFVENKLVNDELKFSKLTRKDWLEGRLQVVFEEWERASHTWHLSGPEIDYELLSPRWASELREIESQSKNGCFVVGGKQCLLDAIAVELLELLNRRPSMTFGDFHDATYGPMGTLKKAQFSEYYKVSKYEG